MGGLPGGLGGWWVLLVGGWVCGCAASNWHLMGCDFKKKVLLFGRLSGSKISARVQAA